MAHSVGVLLHDFAMGGPALYLQFLVDLTSANIKESMQRSNCM